jgi:hypothetical protein
MVYTLATTEPAKHRAVIAIEMIGRHPLPIPGIRNMTPTAPAATRVISRGMGTTLAETTALSLKTENAEMPMDAIVSTTVVFNR